MTEPLLPVQATFPLHLPAPARPTPLKVRITAPITDGPLPVMLFSHGHGASMHAYSPLADRWAAQGFAVIQPTHLDSRLTPLPTAPHVMDIWRQRISDMRLVLDHLELLGTQVPHLADRLDPTRVAAAGHSWGGETVSKLLGARLTSPCTPEDLSDPRIQAGVLLAAPGAGGEALTPDAARQFPFLEQDFVALDRPALVVAGDQDEARLSRRGPAWITDAFHRSPGPKALLTLTGAQHSLGGIPGYEARETTDEQAERVEAIAWLSGAYLRSALNPADPAWTLARDAFRAHHSPLGRIDER